MSGKVSWVFFDCFNTLLMEPGGHGPHPYLTPIASLPVRHGLYGSQAEFLADYAAWYRSRWAAHDGEGASRRDWREVPLAERLTELFRGRRAAERAHADIVAEMVSHLDDRHLPSLKPADKVRDMLARLGGEVRLAVVSNFYIAGWPAMALDHFGLGGHFAFVLDSAAFGIKKPGPAIYEEALRRAGARPEEVVFIGDSLQADVLTPRRLGMRALHYRPASAAARREWEIAHWDELVGISRF